MEILRFPNGTGGTEPVHPIAFHTVMDKLPVNGWQIVQGATSLRIVLGGVHGEVNDAQLSRLLGKVLVSQGALSPRIAVERLPAIPRTTSGKTPLIRVE